MDIYLTRYSDTLISVLDKTNLATVVNADLFISLHCDHSKDFTARGVDVGETHYEYSKDFAWFAYQLQVAFKRKLALEARSVKFYDFQMFREAC